MDAHLPPLAAVRLAVVQTVGVDSRDKLDLARDVAAFVLGEHPAPPSDMVGEKRPAGQGAAEVLTAIAHFTSHGINPTSADIAEWTGMSKDLALWHLRRLKAKDKVVNMGTVNRPKYRLVTEDAAAPQPEPPAPPDAEAACEEACTCEPEPAAEAPEEITPEPKEAAAPEPEEAPEEITSGDILDGLPNMRRQVLQTVIDLMHEGTKITAIAIGERLGGMDDNAVRYHLAELKKAGRLRIDGSPKRPIYSITGAQVALPTPRPARPKPPPVEVEKPIRAKGDAPARRTCLGCGKKFQSWGFGNRFCNSCSPKRRDAAGMGV